MKSLTERLRKTSELQRASGFLISAAMLEDAAAALDRLESRLAAVNIVLDRHQVLADENLRHGVLQSSRDYGEIRAEIVREVREAMLK